MHAAPPAWIVLPFVLYLLGIAVVPLVHAHFWHRTRNKLLVAAATGLPAVAYLLIAEPHGAHWLFDSAKEYVAFIVLLGSLFVISGGILLRGSLAGTPLTNTAFLGIGALLASVVGTTGASMLLIRPLLRANGPRERKTHVVVFFIFVVSNAGGLLTPLGDPPLFLGFLRGVPFLWTLRLILPWAFVNGVLLVLFNLCDHYIFDKEERERPGSQLEEVQQVKQPLYIEGKLNFVWLAGVVAVIFLSGTFGKRLGSEDLQRLVQVLGMAAMAGLSLLTTKASVRAANGFSWAPIEEVAAIFAGIFITMVPALKVLEARGAELGVTRPWQFFWASGILSGLLDNAPTYLTFASLAVGVVNGTHPGAGLDAGNLGALLAFPDGARLLIAISCGSVMMGANTYIGNGPNFMVKAVAEDSGLQMPGFFGYMAWSGAVLVPLFVVVTFVFFYN